MWESMCCCKMITKLELGVIVLFINLVALSVLSQAQDYRCIERKPNEKCMTYAVLRANSHYSSLSNLSSLLSISRAELVEANGFPNDVELFSVDQPILIPIECKCSGGGFYGAEVEKISVKGESFYDIADSLEGLTSSSGIQARNPKFSPWNLPEGTNVLVPLKCACPAPADSRKLLVSYPIKGGDTLAGLAVEFNVSQEILLSANQRYSAVGFTQGNNLVQTSTLLIPLEGKPVSRPGLGGPEESIRVGKPHKRRKKKPKMIGVYIAMGAVGFMACLAAVFFFIILKKKKTKEKEEGLTKNGAADMEMQQLSLSIRTTSDKKVSFEGSQYNFDEAATYSTTTPHKMGVEIYTFEDLHKATEEFSSGNLIGGSVFHGRLKGKNMAVKRVTSDTMCKIDYEILHERVHRHPNIMRMLGTCLTEGADSFIVFEYAKNGSLKDWIHGGLAIKSHFIASCSCFLNWDQRVKICVDVATALQHMHHIMNPSYVHRHIMSRNIFLDEDFSAKVGKFGLSKVGDDQENGYVAPEGTASPSSDVFAYGVVLLEVLSGKPPVTRDEDEKVVKKLCDEIKSVLQSGDAEELREWIDSALGETYSFDGAVMLANLARSCVEDDASLRPSAGEIVEKLLRLVEELPEREEFNVCESSCKPLVNAAAAAE